MPKPHHFDPTILRQYDIRGQMGKTLSETDAYFIGLGFGSIIRTAMPASSKMGGPKIASSKIGGPKIAIGRDGRLSSPALAAALIEGLMASNCHVFDCGIVATPMLYFADRHYACDASIQVTGSHNPPDYNGFKLVRAHKSFFGTDIQHLAQHCATALPTTSGGSCEHIDILPPYISRIRQGADFGTNTIIWDAGNGAAGPAIDALLPHLSGTHKALFTEIDGRFPNHHPNPVDPKTLAMLAREVQSLGADCGIGFDGDGDRIGIIDAKCRPIAGDILTAYLGLDLLTRHAGADILFDVKSSQSAMHLITQAGGVPHVWKTGHSHMKQRLCALKAPLAGEMSGHIFMAEDYYGYDDALYVATRFGTAMQRAQHARGETFTDFIDSLPKTFTTPECSVACEDTRKFAVMADLAQIIARSAPDDAHVNDIDGVRVTTERGWCLMRASNTEGALIMRAEGVDEAALEQFITLLRKALQQVGISWPGPSL